MNLSTPRIGFDRFIKLDWVSMVLAVRRGTTSPAEMKALLMSSGLTNEALAKTLTKLNGLGIQPRHELSEFINRGQSLTPADATPLEVATYAWGVSIANYPFFGKVAELIGRLTMLQGDCAIAELHRRMSELYGDRQVTKRATQATLQTQLEWGLVERVDKGKRLVRNAPIAIENAPVAAWLIEAAVRYTGKSLPAINLHSLPMLFPFAFRGSPVYAVSISNHLDLRSEGPNNQFVSLKAAG